MDDGQIVAIALDAPAGAQAAAQSEAALGEMLDQTVWQQNRSSAGASAERNRQRSARPPGSPPDDSDVCRISARSRRFGTYLGRSLHRHYRARD